MIEIFIVIIVVIIISYLIIKHQENKRFEKFSRYIRRLQSVDENIDHLSPPWRLKRAERVLRNRKRKKQRRRRNKF